MTASVEDLFERYRRGDTQALATVFDRTAPELWRVARHLCGNRVEADDLVQTTYLAAMQSAARWRREQPLLPWLLGILVNHLRMARRRQRRVVPAGARQESQPEDPRVTAERDELRLLLRRHIDELPETYRTVLVLQLEQGMTAAEVAHALGRPRATVRSQLHRGIERLRLTLPPAGRDGPRRDGNPRDESPDLSQVRQAVMLAATGEAAVTTTSIGLGVFAMKNLITAALLLLAIGVIWAWPRVAAAPPVGAANDTGTNVVAERVADPADGAVAVATPERPERIAGSTEPGPTIVRVHARWPDGSNAQAMTVTAQNLPADDWFAQRFVATDLRGVAEFGDLAAGRVRLRARHGGELEVDVVAHVVNEFELAIPAGVDVSGTVVDPEGNVVPDAIVVIGTRIEDMLEATRTDGNGAFHLRALAERTRIAAFAEGFLGSQTVAAADAAAAPLTLQLGTPAGVVTGRVLDADGAPLAGAWVAAGVATFMMDFGGGESKLHSMRVVRTDESGAFRLQAIPFGVPFPLHAGAAGHAGWQGQVNLVPGKTEFVEVRLARAVQLRGVVRDREGQPVARAYVGVTDGNSPGKRIGDTRPSWLLSSDATAADGSFAFLSLAPGPISVQVLNRPSRGEVRAVAWRQFVAKPGESLRWDPVLTADLAIRGSVVDADGEPLGGWRLSADGERSVPQTGSVESGADGSFAIVGCAPAPYTVHCYAPGDAWHVALAELEGVEPGGEPIVVRIGRDRLPSCYLTGSRPADQLDQQLSLIVLDDGQGVQMARLEPGKPFELGPLPPGHYAMQLQASRAGQRGMPLVVPLGDRRLAPGQRAELGELRLPELGELTVELVDPEGVAVPRAYLRLAMIGAPQGGAGMQIVEGRGTARVAPGSYLPASAIAGLCVEHEPILVGTGSTTVRLQLAAGVLRHVRYDLTEVGLPARGFATFRKHGRPVQRTWFTFWQEEPSTLEHRFTPGGWELELELGDGRVQHFPFVVTPDETGEVLDIRVTR